MFEQRRAYVEIEGFSERTGFFGSVEYRNVFAGFGNGFYKSGRNEGTVQTDFDQTVFLALCVQFIDAFFYRFRARAHDYDNVFGVFCSDVIKQMIFSSCQRRNFVHHFLYDVGRRVIVTICGFSVLEVSIAVLRRAALYGMFGIERARLEFGNVFVQSFFLEYGFHFLIIDRIDLTHFMRSTESVEEVDERHARTERGKVRNKRKIHYFLNGTARDHCKSRLTACHDVRMVAEDVQRMCGKGARRNVHNHGEQFARNFIHIGNHQQKSLRSSVSRGQRACR